MFAEVRNNKVLFKIDSIVCGRMALYLGFMAPNQGTFLRDNLQGESNEWQQPLSLFYSLTQILHFFSREFTCTADGFKVRSYRVSSIKGS